MEELIKKIRAIEPTKNQLKDRTPEYAFGWIDAVNVITKVVKNNVALASDSQRSELLLGFQKSEYFDLYEQGVLEYKDAIEKYLA